MDTLARKVLAPLILRAALAVVFVYHGMGKLGPDNEWGLSWNKEMPGALQALVAWGEFLGGIAMAIGFLVRLAALGLASIMVGAIVTVHGANGFALMSKDREPTKLGYEYNLALIAICLGVALLGSGILGLDHWLWPSRRGTGTPPQR
jgi:putative oxidoreductase